MHARKKHCKAHCFESDKKQRSRSPSEATDIDIGMRVLVWPLSLVSFRTSWNHCLMFGLESPYLEMTPA